MSDLIQKRARRRKLITRGAIAAALLLVAFVVVGRLTHREPPPNYRTAQVTRGNIESAIVALGTVDAKNYVDVGAQVSGQLNALHFEVGEQVKQGDLVAEIDPLLAQSRVDADQAQLRELQANRRQQIAQLRLAEAEAARSRALLTADAISQAEAEASAAQYEVAQAQLAQLEAQIDRTQSQLNGDLTSLNYTKIYAPMDGTVISHSAVVGQTLNANQTAPVIMRIADLSVMTVSADVSEADVPRLKTGMQAYFTTLGNPDQRWTASVRQVLPQPEIVNDVVLYKALLDVDNRDNALLPQMSAQVSFILGTARGVLKVPAAALQLPPSMLIAAGVTPRGGRPDIANMTDEERAAARERFQAQGGAPGGPGGGNFQGGAAGGGFQGGSFQADDSQRVAQAAQPTYVTDAATPPRPQTLLIIVNGKPEPREVTVGLVSRTEAEIVSGLEEGQEIILGEAATSAEGAARPAGNVQFRGPPGGFGG